MLRAQQKWIPSNARTAAVHRFSPRIVYVRSIRSRDSELADRAHSDHHFHPRRHHTHSVPDRCLAMDAGDRPWAVSADGLVVTVRLTPKGGRGSIDGIAHLSDGRCVLKARVRAAP